MDLDIYKKHCMFRAERLCDRETVYGYLVQEDSAGALLPDVVNVFHIVQYGYWNGKWTGRDDLVDPETVAIYLGKDDETGRGIYVPFSQVSAIDPIRAAGGCRCGECKYCENLGENKALRCSIETNDVLMGLPFITPDDFCSYGEAREVQNDG